VEDPKQRLTKRVSDAELQRRWKLVREQMKERKIDYLVMQTCEEYMGGTVRWFSDFTARHQFPMTVIFPVDDEMTLINCGFEAPSTDNWPPAWACRGIKNRLGDVYFTTCEYTSTYDAELAISVLKEKPNATIGLVEKTMIPLSFYEHLAKKLPQAKFVDATSWVDELRSDKSPEEIELIRGTAATQDAVMEYLKKVIKPGMRDMDIYAEIHCFLAKQGSERGLVQVNSGPQGVPVPFDVPKFQNRVVKDGDQVTVLIETNGPGGYYTEILRVLTLGKPSQALQDAYGVAAEIMHTVGSRLVPGADPNDLWCYYKEYVQSKGYFPPRRSFAHGQSQSLVDRPNLRPEEPWKIKANMNIAVHPYAVSKEVYTICGDNYLTTNGQPEHLHRYPAEITVI